MLRVKTTAALVAIGCLLTTAAVEAKSITLNVWQPWGDKLGAGMAELGKLYEKTHPGVKIKMITVDNTLDTNTKFFAAMAAGVPPEVIFVDGPQVIQWAQKNVLTNLTSLASASSIKASDYWGSSWKQCLDRGKLFALPWQTDGNFPLVYNRSLFKESGLLNPPKNTEEFEEYTRKINKTDGNGRYIRFGLNPLSWPGANGFFSWGFAFGGEFYDDAKDKMTVNSPKVVQALQWIVDYGKKFDQRRMDSFGTNFTGGKLGMSFFVAARRLDLNKLKVPIDWGWTYIAGPSQGGERQSGWTGGWNIAIPANAKNRNEAWKFVKWMCHDDAGTEATYKFTDWPPAAKSSPAFDKIDKQLVPWVEVMKAAKHVRPVMPVTPVMFTELDNAISQALAGKKSPQAALDTANVNIQKELDKALARLKRK